MNSPQIKEFSDLEAGQDLLMHLLRKFGSFNSSYFLNIVYSGSRAEATSLEIIQELPKSTIWIFEPDYMQVHELKSRYISHPNLRIRTSILTKRKVRFALVFNTWLMSTLISWARKRARFLSSFDLKKGYPFKSGNLALSAPESTTLDATGIIPDVIILDLCGGEYEALQGTQRKLGIVKIIQFRELLLNSTLGGSRLHSSKLLQRAGYELYFGHLHIVSSNLLDNEVKSKLEKIGVSLIRSCSQNSTTFQHTLFVNRKTKNDIALTKFRDRLFKALDQVGMISVHLDIIAVNSKWNKYWNNPDI